MKSVAILSMTAVFAEEAENARKTPHTEHIKHHVPHSRATHDPEFEHGHHAHHKHHAPHQSVSVLEETEDPPKKEEPKSQTGIEGAECNPKDDKCEGSCKKDANDENKGKCEKGGSSCFAGSSLVETINGSVKMSDLKIGDSVRTAIGFEPVVGFLHAEEGAADFFELTHSNGVLPVTGDHLVFLANGDAVAASSIRQGDHLSSGVVINVEKVRRSDGIFAPLTNSGTISVENTLASTYSTVNQMSHSLAHFATTPLRWFGYETKSASSTPVFAVPTSA